MEKGFFNLPNLIENINDKFIFNIQANSNRFDIDKYNFTIEKLKNIRNLNLIFNQLSQTNYQKLLFKSDVILIPYIADFYKYRTSSIFFETINANKIPIVTKDTWMSSFLKSNDTLKKLNLDSKNNLQKILNYIFLNKKKILIEIKKLRESIKIEEDKNNIKNIFKNSKKNKIQKPNFNYIIDDHTINRKKDGNQWGSNILYKNIYKQVNSKELIPTINILHNKINLAIHDELLVKNNFLEKFHNDYCEFQIIEVNRFFNLKDDKLIFKNFIDYRKIDICDYILINYHYNKEIIQKLSILKRKKIIVIVHDQYEQLNNRSDTLIDEKNIYYIFVSYKEFTNNKLLHSEKYLIYPNQLFHKKKYLYKKAKNYNYYFISSGSEIDIKNIMHLLKNIKLSNKINLVGEISNSKEIFNKYSDKINFMGYIDDINQLYSSNQSVFLIPRYYGLGIPIKFLEALKFGSKCVLFGGHSRFGLPQKIILPILKKNNFTELDRFINSINYKKVYTDISKYILKNNKFFLNKFKNEINKL